MTVNKLERFADIAEFNHVFEHTDYQNNQLEKPKGRWQKHIFGNDNPINLELACGTGAYTLELARRNPQQNYIGVDIKGSRIWKGAKQAKEEKLENVRFLRIQIDHLDEYFAKAEVDEIWITFPDPFPRAGDRKKRLTSPKFLPLYKHVLKPEHPVHFKTDSGFLFKYTCKRVKQNGGSILEQVDDIYANEPNDELLTLKTVFEKRHLQNGKTISYCKFVFPKR